MATSLPLPTMFSHALVAFTIEFDNEAEQRMPHRTTRYGATSGPLPKPWLTSMAMYLNCMQFLDENGMSARDWCARHALGLIFPECSAGAMSPSNPNDRWDAPSRQKQNGSFAQPKQVEGHRKFGNR